MKLKEAVTKTVYRGALYYTLITAVMSALGILLSEDASVDILRPARFLLVLLFSYIAASVSVLRQSRRFSATASLIIHFLGFTLGFYLCLVLPSNLSFSPSFIIGATRRLRPNIYSSSISRTFSPSDSRKS